MQPPMQQQIPQQMPQQIHQQMPQQIPQPQQTPNPRKRRSSVQTPLSDMAGPIIPGVDHDPTAAAAAAASAVTTPTHEPGKKKGRTNTPWTAEEEHRLKSMRDAGNTWSEIAKVCPPSSSPCPPFC